jgi:hypothetical protein
MPSMSAYLSRLTSSAPPPCGEVVLKMLFKFQPMHACAMHNSHGVMLLLLYVYIGYLYGWLSGRRDRLASSRATVRLVVTESQSLDMHEDVATALKLRLHSSGELGS